MAGPSARPHGVGLRGLSLSRASSLFEGPFGRLFRSLPAAEFGNSDQATTQALSDLAGKMLATPDPISGDPDPEESGIPAAYTYFGQFIDHDLTFDPASSLQKQNDPDALEDFRTPRFDLDCVYGRGPDDQPYLYEDNGRRFNLGSPLTGAAGNPRARDLPRNTPTDGNARRALIGDPRNDENVIVSQFHGLMLRLHNRIADLNPTWSFSRVQREVRFHYQWVVLNDFLPTIIHRDTLWKVLPRLKAKSNPRTDRPVLDFFHWRNEPFMPLEFSAAAYRFGHSMVRPGYRLSETVGPLAIFHPNPNQGLTGFRDFPSNWAIDWHLFIDMQPRHATNSTRTQLAYRIDTSIVNPLGSLPFIPPQDVNALAARNLLRGWRMRLPSGQSIARAMGLQPLADKDILIGKFTGDAGDILGPVAGTKDSVFSDNCPLWTYVLAETVEVELILKVVGGEKKIKTRQLGPVGGRIVAETFAGLLVGDSTSYLNLEPLWKPSLGKGGEFRLRDLIAAALEG